jgi:predicted enzyme related to lactoylglutathione lyase
MEIDRHAPGTFCWFELATTDQAAAKSFYQSLFGWSVTETPMGPDEVYTLFQIDGRDVAAAYGMRAAEREQGIPPNWLVYVSTDSADMSAARATTLGGTILAPPFDVSDFGRMAVVRDPTGATFAIWQPKKNQGTGVTDLPGTACWADLSTHDQAAAAAFYSRLFGWQMVKGKDMTSAQPGDYYHIVCGSDFIGGVPPASNRDPNAPPHWLLYFAVDDCDDAVSRARKLGARVYVEPMTIGNTGRLSVLADPQGAVFAVFEAMDEAA